MCHDCPDRQKVRRNCPKPLSGKVRVRDRRDLSQPPRCAVLTGKRPDGSEIADDRTMQMVWWMLEVCDIMDRADPSTISARLYNWHRVVRHQYSSASESWRNLYGKIQAAQREVDAQQR